LTPSAVGESTLEDVAVEWFDSLGYERAFGPGIAPGEVAAEGGETATSGPDGAPNIPHSAPPKGNGTLTPSIPLSRRERGQGQRTRAALRQAPFDRSTSSQQASSVRHGSPQAGQADPRHSHSCRPRRSGYPWLPTRHQSLLLQMAGQNDMRPGRFNVLPYTRRQFLPHSTLAPTLSAGATSCFPALPLEAILPDSSNRWSTVATQLPPLSCVR